MKTIVAERDQLNAGALAAQRSMRGALTSLSLTMLLSSLGTSIANVGLPTLAESFHASFQDIQWVVLAYLLAITTLIVSLGRLGDLMGRRRLMLAGLWVFILASLLCALASSLWLLISARLIQGVGAAAMMSLTMAFIGETVPKDKTGSAMGLLGTMSAIGTALGPSLGGVLIASLGWQSIFFINLPLGLLALLLAYRYLPLDRPNSQRPRFDHVGTLLLVLTLAAFAFAMTSGQGNFGQHNLILLACAALGLGLFILAESKTAAPLIHLGIFRNSRLSAGFATSCLVAVVIMATLIVGPFYLSGALALDAARIGLVMSSGPIVSALTGLPAGRLVDKFGAQRISIYGLIGMTFGTSLMAIMPASFGIPGYIIPLVLITTHYAIFQAANNTAVMANTSADQRGLVAGMLSLSRNLGLITGAALMGAVFAFGLKTHTSSAQDAAVAAGMQLTFAVAAALIFVALVIALISHSRSPQARN